MWAETEGVCSLVTGTPCRKNEMAPRRGRPGNDGLEKYSRFPDRFKLHKDNEKMRDFITRLNEDAVFTIGAEVGLEDTELNEDSDEDAEGIGIDSHEAEEVVYAYVRELKGKK